MKEVGAGPSVDASEIILQAAARLLSESPFASASISDVALAADVTEQYMRTHFSDLGAVGDAILDRERVSMHEIMIALRHEPSSPLIKLVSAFERVGRNLRDDVVVRAGVRLASESRGSFPHRRIDPFATWRAFVLELLHEAVAEGEMEEITAVEEAARVVVAAGIGTKDLIAFHGTWDSAPVQMAATAQILVDYMRRPRFVSRGVIR